MKAKWLLCSSRNSSLFSVWCPFYNAECFVYGLQVVCATLPKERRQQDPHALQDNLGLVIFRLGSRCTTKIPFPRSANPIYHPTRLKTRPGRGKNRRNRLNTPPNAPDANTYINTQHNINIHFKISPAVAARSGIKTDALFFARSFCEGSILVTFGGLVFSKFVSRS